MGLRSNQFESAKLYPLRSDQQVSLPRGQGKSHGLTCAVHLYEGQFSRCSAARFRSDSTIMTIKS